MVASLRTNLLSSNSEMKRQMKCLNNLLYNFRAIISRIQMAEERYSLQSCGIYKATRRGKPEVS